VENEVYGLPIPISLTLNERLGKANPRIGLTLVDNVWHKVEYRLMCAEELIQHTPNSVSYKKKSTRISLYNGVR